MLALTSASLVDTCFRRRQSSTHWVISDFLSLFGWFIFCVCFNLFSIPILSFCLFRMSPCCSFSNCRLYAFKSFFFSYPALVFVPFFSCTLFNRLLVLMLWYYLSSSNFVTLTPYFLSSDIRSDKRRISLLSFHNHLVVVVVVAAAIFPKPCVAINLNKHVKYIT